MEKNNIEIIPEALRDLKIWTLRKGKIPYYDLKRKASSTDPKTWGSFQEKMEMWERHPEAFSGLGIMMDPSHNLCFIDLDHCISEAGVISEKAFRILKNFNNNYAEISQSGTGIHIITLGRIPKNVKNSNENVEIYDHSRFCAITGKIFLNHDPSDSQDLLNALYDEFSLPETSLEAPKRDYSSKADTLRRSDEWIVQKAMEHGKMFPYLYNGNWAGAGKKSHSEADESLCTILAFWTDCDIESMDRIFRSSGLYREKWEREDYRSETLDRACQRCTKTLREFIYEKECKEIGNYEHAFLNEF